MTVRGAPKAVELQLGGTLKLLMTDVSEGEGGCIVTLTCERFSVTARGDDMAYTLPADKQVAIKVSYVDANNNPAVVDGEVVWASSDGLIATVTANAADSKQATIVPGSSVGQAQITATADADLGAGIRELITTMDLTVVGGEAVAGTIEPVGAPTPKP
jgi:hypothetical protein